MIHYWHEMELVLGGQVNQTACMPEDENAALLCDPNRFEFLRFHWEREGEAWLEARRADGPDLNLRGVSEEEKRIVTEVAKEIEHRIDNLKRRLSGRPPV